MRWNAAPRGESHDRRHNNRDDGEGNAEYDHRRESDDQCDERTKRTGQRRSEHLPQGIHIVGVFRHDLAMRMLVEIADGQGLHVAEHIAT